MRNSLLKKILLINDYEKGGGAEKVFSQTCDLLSQEFIVSKYVGQLCHIINEGTPHKLYSTFKSGGLSRIYSFQHFKNLLNILNTQKPDIIHLHNYYNSLSPSVLSAIRKYRRNGNKIKVVFTAHDYHLLCPFSSFMYYSFLTNEVNFLCNPPNINQILLYKWDSRGFPYSIVKKIQWLTAYFINDLYNEINHIIAPSIFLADLLKRKYCDIPISVVRNPFVINTHLILPFSTKPKTDTLKLIYVGRLSPEKGLLQFLHNLAKIDSVKYLFKIIGDGPLKIAIQKIIQEYNLNDRVVITGELPHQSVLNELIINDALVLPSLWYENAPLALVEGAFMNLRLITANYGGMKEIAELCGGAYLMDPNDCNSVNAALNKCYQDVIIDKLPVNRNGNVLKTMFSDERYLNQLIDIYNK